MSKCSFGFISYFGFCSSKPRLQSNPGQYLHRQWSFYSPRYWNRSVPIWSNTQPSCTKQSKFSIN